MSRRATGRSGTVRFDSCAWSVAVSERQVELTVGESVRIGDVVVTIVDIEEDQIHVRIDEDDDPRTNDAQQRDFVLALPR